jgi:hypothetical protein
VWSSGTPFKFHVLLLVKFWNLQSCRKRELARFCTFWSLHIQTAQTMPTPTSIELFLCQNPVNGETWFLKCVAIDGTQIVPVVCDLSFSKESKLWKIDNSQTNLAFRVRSSGTPFEYYVLLLGRFWNFQTCRKKGVGKVLPLLAIAPPNSACQPPLLLNFSGVKIPPMVKHDF